MDESSFLSPAAAIVAEHVSRLSHELDRANDELRQARGRAEAAMAESDLAARELRRAEDQVRALVRENSTLRAEKASLQQLCLEYVTAKEQLDRLRSALEEMFGGGAWSFLKKAGKVRRRLSRESTISGRALRFGVRLLRIVLKLSRTSIESARSVAQAAHRWQERPFYVDSADEGETADPQGLTVRPPTTYGELPWRQIDECEDFNRTPRGYFQVLLVAPAEEDADGIADLLRLAEGLSRSKDFDCRVVLEGRGASDAFARIIPTLEIDSLLESGAGRAQATGLVADLFRQLTYHRVAVISSATAGDFFAALTSRDIGVIPWLSQSPRAILPSRENSTWDGSAGWSGFAFVPTGRDADAEARRLGFDPTRLQLVGRVSAADPDPADPDGSRLVDDFIGLLKEEYDYHPSVDLKISVIVPNYNHARYLEERLRSIFEQTHRPHEILFLDDASNDESVQIARRLAAESPVPFHLIPNERNSGSTFRQWLKGIEMAGGELVWIAESDDSCRPELLERLVPEFFDPAVALAYCQSVMIGPEGERLPGDYISLTNDLSMTHWRQPYSVPAVEEVELALSQRNTIPNASAVLFRKRMDLDCRADLERMRLAGDWLFYAMQIRDGRIAYVPDPLNFHRHHNRTVRHAFERAAELVEEQLLVKARIFESFPISANAITRSVSYTVAESLYRARALDLEWPALTDRPVLSPLIGRVRSALRARRGPSRDLRVLMVLSGTDGSAGQQAAIRLANGLSGSFHVFLISARPWMTDPAKAALVDDRITLLEGTLGMTFWAGERETLPDGNTSEAVSSSRAEIIAELIRIHRIDVIHSLGWWADRLVAAVMPEPSLPWFIDLRHAEEYREDSGRDPDFQHLATSMIARIQGLFCSQPGDLDVFPANTRERLGQVVRIVVGIDPGARRPGGDRASRRGDALGPAVSMAAEAYLAAVDGAICHPLDSSRLLQTA